jgi:UDP-glucose:(heptosyl)LPS alpha-1,3-glucosyltransferase
MTVVTPGVKSVPGPASEDERRAARIRLGLPLEGTCILFVANDYRKKGLPVLLEALLQLPESCYLAVVGNAAQIPLYSDKVKELKLHERVIFVGSLQDMNVAYLAADCLAHPTLEDTFAMVVLEAMAHGLPVVVSGAKYCGISQLLVDGENALILQNPLNSHQISAAIFRLIAKAALSVKLSHSGSVFANKYINSVVSEQQASIYDVMKIKVI